MADVFVCNDSTFIFSEVYRHLKQKWAPFDGIGIKSEARMVCATPADATIKRVTVGTVTISACFMASERY